MAEERALPVKVWRAEVHPDGRIEPLGEPLELRFVLHVDEARESWSRKKNDPEMEKLAHFCFDQSYLLLQEGNGEARPVLWRGSDSGQQRGSLRVHLQWLDSEAEGLRAEEADWLSFRNSMFYGAKETEELDQKLQAIRQRLAECRKRDRSWIVER